ncbi:hypothetical protein BDV95DRAFT_610998 [Massariosphaeria phaeospora]|uniref:Uncharacterized protein n=1 Tax=Massariosphaeria phaeospora TaxID=100035 RepID=A0A7C8I1X1_9PLEO|nr:hypothetical protein BDV95DRAFT_610998 [Massariosphaeria phaeospora]
MASPSSAFGDDSWDFVNQPGAGADLQFDPSSDLQFDDGSDLHVDSDSAFDSGSDLQFDAGPSNSNLQFDALQFNAGPSNSDLQSNAGPSNSDLQSNAAPSGSDLQFDATAPGPALQAQSGAAAPLDSDLQSNATLSGSASPQSGPPVPTAQEILLKVLDDPVYQKIFGNVVEDSDLTGDPNIPVDPIIAAPGNLTAVTDMNFLSLGIVYPDDPSLIPQLAWKSGLMIPLAPQPPSTAADGQKQLPDFTNLDFSEFDVNNSTSNYPAYTGAFKNAREAREYRQRVRRGPKPADDVELIKTQRQFWVKRLYNAMINTAQIIDGAGSNHLKRFTVYKPEELEALDVEAVAHEIFDACVHVHEKGWTYLKLYHKDSVRGSKVDSSKKSLRMRLERICHVLKTVKATCDDALRSGVTLALLADNPDIRIATKKANNTGNAKRKAQIELAKKVEKKVAAKAKAAKAKK